MIDNKTQAWLDELAKNDRHEVMVGKYRIYQGPSVYSSRNNAEVGVLYDVRVWFNHDKSYGAIVDGKYYTTVLVLACEDGHVIQGSETAVPDEILTSLSDLGFCIGGDRP